MSILCQVGPVALPVVSVLVFFSIETATELSVTKTVALVP